MSEPQTPPEVTALDIILDEEFSGRGASLPFFAAKGLARRVAERALAQSVSPPGDRTPKVCDECGIPVGIVGCHAGHCSRQGVSVERPEQGQVRHVEMVEEVSAEGERRMVPRPERPEHGLIQRLKGLAQLFSEHESVVLRSALLESIVGTLRAAADALASRPTPIAEHESDAAWRNRWHDRLGRGPSETEGRFYERLEKASRPTEAPRPAPDCDRKYAAYLRDLAGRLLEYPTDHYKEAHDALITEADDQDRELLDSPRPEGAQGDAPLSAAPFADRVESPARYRALERWRKGSRVEPGC